ncbi:MAG: N-formylglutamate amidohydrolase [Candidatus Woesearchaeota archaeon]
MKKFIKNNIKLFYNILVFSKRTLSLKDRFFLFRQLNKLWDKMSENPHLNFLSQLKDYQIVGDVLDGDIEHFYRTRNALWFKNYFEDRDLYNIVKKDIEDLYPNYKHIRVTITHKGILVYENYKKNQFNTLLLTVHNGTWVDKDIKKNMIITDKRRLMDEDLGSGRLYSRIVLEEGGIWIDSKQSRFMCDFNRSYARAIYANNQEKMLKKVWKQELDQHQKDIILDSYRHFYYLLSRLIDTYKFNIIFDGHTMRGFEGRPNISFGTNYIPGFYIPIVNAFIQRLRNLGYKEIKVNVPYKGGYILKFLSRKFPNMFIFSMEINKKLYIKADEITLIDKDIEKISKDLITMLKIENEDKDAEADESSKD